MKEDTNNEAKLLFFISFSKKRKTEKKGFERYRRGRRGRRRRRTVRRRVEEVKALIERKKIIHPFDTSDRGNKTSIFILTVMESSRA